MNVHIPIGNLTPIENLENYMARLGQKAQAAANTLRLASSAQKETALRAMADAVRARTADIAAANDKDMAAGTAKGLTSALLDRLKLDAGRIEAIACGLDAIAALPDPVGIEDKRWTRPNGLTISKVRVPIGVLGIIYESRPNVTADAGALCVKSGNACILRGGSESAHSSGAIFNALQAGLRAADMPEDAVQMIATTDRAAVGHLLSGLGGTVNLIIPRGGKSLIARVQQDARVPVLAHLEGLCHTYVHKQADPDMALDIVLNAKMRRTGVCGATETLIIDETVAAKILPIIAKGLIDLGCELRGDEAACALISDMSAATPEDWATEYLDAIISIKIVPGIEEALAHIAHYSSGHTDAIITDDAQAAERFLADVDSAICVHNASTQYADGGEFGFGAEIGIATGRLHARGPVGAEHLTTYKYAVHGTGQTRPK